MKAEDGVEGKLNDEHDDGKGTVNTVIQQDLVRVEHEKVTHIYAQGDLDCVDQSVHTIDLMVLHRAATFDTMEETISMLNQMATWVRYLYVSGLVIKDRQSVAETGDVVGTDWQVMAENWRKVGNGIWESKVLHRSTMIQNQIAHD